MQHPKQGLKMQSWGWAVRRDVVQTTAAPKQHPPPSLRSPWGPERLERLGEQMRSVLHLPSTSAPSHLPPPLTPPAAEARATGAGGSQALTFVTVMQELRGAAGARARRAGAAVGVRWGPGRQREGVPRGLARSRPGRLWALSRAPRKAQLSLGAALQPGSAQGPLVGARPPLVADVSPECAFIIDEPPSPQEGEAGRKGERERAQAAGRGEEEGPGTRYKGGGGGRRRRRKHAPARCLALRRQARLPAAGHCCSRGPGRAPRPAALTPSGPRTPGG